MKVLRASNSILKQVNAGKEDAGWSIDATRIEKECNLFFVNVVVMVFFISC